MAGWGKKNLRWCRDDNGESIFEVMMALEGLMVEGGLQLQLSCIECRWRWCCIWMELKTPTASTAMHHHHRHFFIQELGIECECFLVFTNSLHRKNTALHYACPWSAVSLQWQADHTQRHRQTGWVSHILYVCKNSMTGRPHTDTHMDGRGGLGGRTAWKCKELTCLLICTNVSVQYIYIGRHTRV